MKKLFTILFLLNIGLAINTSSALDRTLEEVRPDSMTISLARMMSKDVFNSNGVMYLQPTVEVMNITSNARFYNSAYVPTKVKKPYFKFGIHAMYGFVPDNRKTYSPLLPSQELTTEELLKYGSVDIDFVNPENSTFEISDTAGLVYAALKGMIYDGLKNGSIKMPKDAPTGLGSGKQSFNLPSDTLQKLFENLTLDLPFLGKTKLYDYLPDSLKNSLGDIFKSFPEFFNLPEGANLDHFMAFVPQIEIGSLFGTELLIRYIPPVNMGKDIGDFAFWGFGLKHSISQYFNTGDELENRYFDMAIQAVYQGTTLKNSIGVTNADLTADATMFNVNLHASKSFKDLFDVYTGLSYESISIKSEYVFYLPIEMQWELGLIDKFYYQDKEKGIEPNFKPSKKGDPQTEYDHPGDQSPQKAKIELAESAIKWTIGLSRAFGPLTVFADFNISTLMMFSGGIVYTF
jgi:hypothetical protein